LDETPRWTVCSASDNASRSHRNFTCPPPDCFLVHLLLLSVAVGAGENRDTSLFPERSGPVGHVDRLGESVDAPEGRRSVSPAPPGFPTGPSPWSGLRSSGPSPAADDAGQILDLTV